MLQQPAAPLVLAGDITDWLDGTVGWISGFAPAAFLAGVFVLGAWMLITTRGMFKKLVVFALGAAVVYMLLTRVGAIADMFGSELDPDAGSWPAVVRVDGDGDPGWLV
ncbi:hypothetical protein [Micromonospora aurantiaca (nom. illeg.)]|uniref:hypothetical protein n=1 Tax=Micromonospora aurantiaca (nom. illeg.) TaxID=47850 RepID=UPI0033E8E6EB